MKSTPKTLLKYLVTVAIAALVSLVMLDSQNFWSATEAVDKYRMLSDALSIPGIVLMGFAALMWVASDGFFDGFGYAFSRFGNLFVPAFKKKHETYGDYKMRKSESRKEKIGSYAFLLFVGIAFFASSIVFVILHGTVYVPKV